MPDDHTVEGWACVFCNQLADKSEPITVVNHYGGEDGRKQQQYWVAHSACFIEHMHPEMRANSAPLTK